ncbi:MAG: hypothetical protein A2341_04350 [Deltaproteobacteria bacterium RIFOXYB12_FULL_58_9]|nr:MAG: hypothetical protein A2341_04350 [Deltaproteobacteria bacterium RIFOXYB12_FULL_58_9]
MSKELHNQAFDLHAARTLATVKQLPPQVAEALVAAVLAPPRPRDWQSFLSWFLAFAGAALALSGVIFFFAYNWANLGRFAKLGLLEFAIMAATLGAWKFGDRLSGRISLMASVILVGPLLAVYGQTYQTGSDPFELFLGWLLLTLPWVALARMPVLWIVSLTLLNTAYLLYWGQVLDGRYNFGESVPAYLVLVLINFVPCAVWELLNRRGIAWLMPRWPPRLMAVACCTAIVACLIVMIVGEAEETAGHGVLAVLAGLIAVGASVIYYRVVLHDLFMVALAAASVMTVLTVGFGRILFADIGADTGGAFVLGFFVVAQVAGAASWLRWEARRMNRTTPSITPERGVTS